MLKNLRISPVSITSAPFLSPRYSFSPSETYKTSPRRTRQPSLAKTFEFFKNIVVWKKEEKTNGGNQKVVYEAVRSGLPTSNLLEIFRTNSYQLLQQPEMCYCVPPRLVVWRMEKVNREMFEVLANRSSVNDADLAEMLFGDLCSTEKAKSFVATIRQTNSEVFEQNADPVFDDFGNILKMSKKVFFQIALDSFDDKDYLDLFVTSWKFFFTPKELCKLCVEEALLPAEVSNDSLRNFALEMNELKEKETKKADKRMKTQSESRVDGILQNIENSEAERKRRLEKILLYFLSIEETFDDDVKEMLLIHFDNGRFSDEIENLIKKSLENYGSSFSSFNDDKSPRVVSYNKSKRQSYQIKEERMERKKRKSRSTSRDSMCSYPVSEKSECVDDEKVFDVNYENFLSLSPCVIGKQLIFYHRELFENLPLKDFYFCESSNKLKKYSQKFKAVDHIFEKIVKQQNGVSVFIKIANVSVTLRDYTVGHSLFNLINALVKEQPERVSELDAATKEMFEKLKRTFDENNDFKNYREEYESLDNECPKTPSYIVWKKEMEELKKDNVEDKGLLDIQQVKKMSQHIQIIAMAKASQFLIDQNVSFQFFFHSNF
ncbi:hypothetical protein EIN_032110 [Entamoeba invadens IP1]|uniref:Ras-GEF domain-containing protein n=1 Tax=Entamoeba invadens IP1 TaxID=370355 RepID=A0A0A1TY96_ENTIV|nr:hypothetical protein EIN_032110 [Entamoeba invadens IP1]ELP86460.1 hypothetical protein EIN_032110 [Entamoeba invadens IP1]|eukprot:XP_004185806.1 hypothetical protein EIN_032110 [Entamoeba invadens IP1]